MQVEKGWVIRIKATGGSVRNGGKLELFLREDDVKKAAQAYGNTIKQECEPQQALMLRIEGDEAPLEETKTPAEEEVEQT